MKASDVTICGHGSARPSLKNMETYCRNRYQQKASNGVRKGLVAVRRLKGLTDEDRQRFHDAYATIIGRNKYSQALREYVYTKYKDGLYYSDCSSSGCYTFKHIGVKCSDLNTAGIYWNFDMTLAVIQNGQIINPEVLQVGDALLFSGNDPTRPKQIGHVEWVYEIPGTAPAPDPGPRMLRKGDKGEDVKRMQQLLIAAGFPCGYYGADGDFGGATLAALRAFQKAVGLEVDGIYGPMSRAVLEATEVKTGTFVSENVRRANVRSKPGTSYPVIMVLSGGYPVTLLGEEAEDETGGWKWVKINAGGRDGWIAKHLLV